MGDLAERNPAAYAKELTEKTGSEIIGLPCDVASEDDVKNLFDEAMKKFGRVDVVLNNAAATGEHLMKEGDVFAPFEEYPLAVWERVLRTNLTGVFLVAREGGRAMRQSGGGSLINVSSLYGVRGPDHRLYEGMPFKSFPGYSASKAGVHGLTLWSRLIGESRAFVLTRMFRGGVSTATIRNSFAATPIVRPWREWLIVPI
jgi:NAD(P)-dependent dehydrogenase (short-subunit alcohol dehydrogenase family)